MMRTFILALFFLVALVAAEHLRGSEQEDRDLAGQTICSMVPTEDMWVALVKPMGTPPAAARAAYQACVAAQNGGNLREGLITRPGCYEQASVQTWLKSEKGVFECRSNKDCADARISDRCYYYYGRSTCKNDIQVKPQCDTIPVAIGGPNIAGGP